MVKNISNQEIKRKRRDLIQQKEKSNKSFYQMIDDLDEDIYKLKEEKNDSQILTEKYQKEILNTDKKIEEKSEEKRKYTDVWLSYVHCLEDFKDGTKVFHILIGIAGGVSGIIGCVATKDVLVIPIAIAGATCIDICACLAAKIYNKFIIKTLKLEHFNNKHITEEEMQEIIKAKEKEIDPELDKLNETRRNLINAQQETYQRIDKISKEQEELEINRKILMQEALRNANKEDYIDDYLNDEIKEYVNLISKESSNTEGQPKVQRKRFKVVNSKNN